MKFVTMTRHHVKGGGKECDQGFHGNRSHGVFSTALAGPAESDKLRRVPAKVVLKGGGAVILVPFATFENRNLTIFFQTKCLQMTILKVLNMTPCICTVSTAQMSRPS